MVIKAVGFALMSAALPPEAPPANTLKDLSPLLTIVAFAAVAPTKKNAILSAPLLLIVAFPAVAPSKKPAKLLLLIVALAALDVSKNRTKLFAALLLIVAFPAVALSKKSAKLFDALLLIVALPAVDVPRNCAKLNSPLLLIVCTFPELFTMPAPWRFRLTADKVTWIENALAPGMKVMEEMVMSVERVGEVCVEVPKVAVSPALTGATPPDQFVPEFQSAEAGAFSQVASTASAEEGRSRKQEVRKKQEASSRTTSSGENQN
jgi:hypothetical protein